MAQHQYTPTVLARFWIKVNKDSGREWNGTACWEWTASTAPDGYGWFALDGKRLGSHRVSYEMAFGAIPDGLWVLHHCDNPSCVCPEHLFLGTSLDNHRDMVAKNRQAQGDRHGSRTRPESRLRGEANPIHRRPELAARGERQGSSKLTADKVRAIRSAYASGTIGQTALAAAYGISQNAVWAVVNRRSWAHID